MRVAASLLGRPAGDTRSPLVRLAAGQTHARPAMPNPYPRRNDSRGKELVQAGFHLAEWKLGQWVADLCGPGMEVPMRVADSMQAMRNTAAEALKSVLHHVSQIKVKDIDV